MSLDKLRRLFRPSRVWPVVICLIIAAELAIGGVVYQSYDFLTALIALAGVPLFAAVDYLARQRSDDARPRWYRSYLALWCLVPFVCALAGSFWVHYQKRREGLDDVRQLTIDIRQTVTEQLADRSPARTWGLPILPWQLCWTGPAPRITTEDINKTVAALAGQRFAADTKVPGLDELKSDSPMAMASEESRRFSELARVAGHDLRLACGDVNVVYDRIADDTVMDFGLALTVQALFVLWIPILLAISIARAHRRDKHRGPRGVSDSLHSRDARILAEDRYLFVPRFCFGALLVLGTNYVFSPFGLKATYIMATVDEHALPGHPSWVLWSTSFAAVPVLVVGFVGFLLYALITASQRFALDDLDDQSVLSLLVRGLVVILLCFALSSSPMNDTVTRIFVFVAGVFPLRALEALAKKANIAIDPDFDGAVSSFDGLPSLDPAKVFALRSAGIQSTYDLAATPIEEIAERVRIDPRLLGRAVDRAILIDAMGLQLTKRLEPFAITSATELVALKDKIPALVEVLAIDPTMPVPAPLPPPPTTEPGPVGDVTVPIGPPSQLHDAAVRVAERLANDVRVAQVRMWLAGSTNFDGLQLDAPTELVLRAAGFESIKQLIDVPLIDVAKRARLEPCMLGDVIDRAILVDTVGIAATQQLAHHQIFTATGLVDHAPEQTSAIVEVLGNTMVPVLDRLSHDRRLTEARRWLACMPHPPTRPPTNPVL